MAMFHILSPELGLFILVLGGVIGLRKFVNFHSISIVEGMLIYVPPQKEDFDAFEESNKTTKAKKKKGGKKEHDKEQPKA